MDWFIHLAQALIGLLWSVNPWRVYQRRCLLCHNLESGPGFFDAEPENLPWAIRGDKGYYPDLVKKSQPPRLCRDCSFEIKELVGQGRELFRYFHPDSKPPVQIIDREGTPVEALLDQGLPLAAFTG